MFAHAKALAGAGAIALALLGTTAADVRAASIIGLVDGKTLVTIDPKTRKVTGSTEIYTLSLHDALPICPRF